MSENEAIDVILKDHSTFKNPMSKAYVMACKALEEIQQYRAIETELREQYHANVNIKILMQHFIETIFKGENHEGFCILTNEDAKMWDEYQAIGTIEEFKALKEKSVAKKPIRNDLCTCPSCGTYNEVIKKRRNTVCFDTVYCWHCGQAMEIKRD